MIGKLPAGAVQLSHFIVGNDKWTLPSFHGSLDCLEQKIGVDVLLSRHALQIGVSEVGDLKLAALSGCDAYCFGKTPDPGEVHCRTLAEHVILHVQEVKVVVQRETAALGRLPNR